MRHKGIKGRAVHAVGVGAVLGLLAFGAGTAAAAPSPVAYTKHGDVLVTLAVAGGCSTITWPKGTTDTLCDFEDGESYQARQYDIVPGDTFGASIESWVDAGVSCRVLDITTGDLVHKASAGGGGTADCLRHAVERRTPAPTPPPLFGSSGS
ncbi:hypothetical protein ACWFOS_18310 [Gordonia terrae]